MLQDVLITGADGSLVTGLQVITGRAMHGQMCGSALLLSTWGLQNGRI